MELSIDFIEEKDIHVVMVSVPKGSRPIYTANDRVYIRELDESRPATPDEIENLVKKTK